MEPQESEPIEPELKDFEPILGPEEPPERWWKRYLSYVLLCLAVPAVVTTAVLLYVSGVGGRPSRDMAERMYERDPEGFNRRAVEATEVAGALAFLATAGICVAQEIQVLKGRK